MTGYVPNRSDAAVAESMEEPFWSLGDPCVDDLTNATLNSQISCIFPVHGTGQWIAMADRWLPKYHVDAKITDLFTRPIAMRSDPEHYHTTEDKVQEMLGADVLESADTSTADYVLLPIGLEDRKPVLRWQEAWRPELPKTK